MDNDNDNNGTKGVMQILANKVSRKGAIIAMAMVLIYMIAATPNVSLIILFVGTIAGLAVFFTGLQWWLDYGVKKKKGE